MDWVSYGNYRGTPVRNSCFAECSLHRQSGVRPYAERFVPSSNVVSSFHRWRFCKPWKYDLWASALNAAISQRWSWLFASLRRTIPGVTRPVWRPPRKNGSIGDVASCSLIGNLSVSAPGVLVCRGARREPEATTALSHLGCHLRWFQRSTLKVSSRRCGLFVPPRWNEQKTQFALVSRCPRHICACLTHSGGSKSACRSRSSGIGTSPTSQLHRVLAAWAR